MGPRSKRASAETSGRSPGGSRAVATGELTQTAAAAGDETRLGWGWRHAELQQQARRFPRAGRGPSLSWRGDICDACQAGNGVDRKRPGARPALQFPQSSKPGASRRILNQYQQEISPQLILGRALQEGENGLTDPRWVGMEISSLQPRIVNKHFHGTTA